MKEKYYKLIIDFIISFIVLIFFLINYEIYDTVVENKSFKEWWIVIFILLLYILLILKNKEK